jgi:hypothetical protein
MLEVFAGPEIIFRLGAPMFKKIRVSSVYMVCALAVLAASAGCGGGGNSQPAAPPAQEGFNDQSLTGSYAFSVTGVDTVGPFAFAGSLQANGDGVITGGTVDLNTQTLTSPTTATLTGTYSVLSDGRTMANVTTSAGLNFSLDFVLLSNSTGLVIRSDSAGTASGRIDLQNSSDFSDTALAGSFAFNLSGVDVNELPDTTAGAFTFDSTGNISTGVQDMNDDGTLTANATISGGTVASPTSGRGTITLDTSTGLLDFAYYVIDANHIRIVSTDPAPVFSGDAFRQPSSFTTSSTFAAGSFAFTVAGDADNSPFAEGGILTADGNGNITAGTEDLNVAGALTENIPVSGTYTIASTGRGTLSLNSGQEFAIYPTMTGGVQIMDLASIDNGTALEQSATTFSNSSITGAYGLNFTGINLSEGVEVDAISQFTADGNGNITGALDLNNSGTLSSGQSLSGTYATSPNGRGTATLNFPAETALGLSNLNVVYYAVSGSQALFIETDGAQVSVGVFSQQTQQ